VRPHRMRIERGPGCPVLQPARAGGYAPAHSRDQGPVPFPPRR
jgi:hypothetical protein